MSVTGFVPPHVPAALVRHYDFRHDPEFRSDPWGWMEALNDGPDIFWSPDLGGYWVVTRGPLIEEVFARGDLFSVKSLAIPRFYVASAAQEQRSSAGA